MNFDEFKRQALTTLLRNQQEDFSWDNPITTAAAIEVLAEHIEGADPLCLASGIGAALNSELFSRSPLTNESSYYHGYSPSTHRFSIESVYANAISRGLRTEFIASELDSETRVWIAARQIRVWAL